jgi:beta-1,4-N-acetylglucosaminyltransferase
MIFVTVGNDFRSFDRLLRKMDEIALRIPSEIVIQRGYSKYSPKNVKHFDFVPLDTATEYIRKARLVVSHAGMGTIILCKEYGIPILIFPRRKRYREHMNDHQLEIAKALEKREGENIYVIYEEDQLEEKILKVLKEETRCNPIKNVGRVNLIRTIKAFIKTT